MADRDIQSLKSKGKQLIQVITTSSIENIAHLLEGALHVGSGEYNVNYRLYGENESVVMRVSKYMKDHLFSISHMLMKDASYPLPYKAIISKDASVAGQLNLNMDPVRIKNTVSYVTNMLIEQNICPHYVYMIGEADAKGFCAYVGVPDPHKDFKRYTNVSLHESFDLDLHKAIVQERITPFQLRIATFQVLHGLMMLQHYMPGFRHNDLKINNILLKLDGYTEKGAKDQKSLNYTNKYHNANKDGNGKFREYNIYVSENSFASAKIPDVGVFAAISDFDLANAPVTVAYADGNLGIPKKVSGATLMNYILTRRGNFANVDAQRALSNKAMASFDTFVFLKSMYDAITSSQSTVNRYQEAFYWLQSLNMHQYAGKRYIESEIPALVPTALINHGSFLRFDQQVASKPVAVYAPKEVMMTMQYLGDDEERSYTGESGNKAPGNAVSFLNPQRSAFYRYTPGVFNKYQFHFIEFFRNNQRKPTFQL